MPWDLMERNPGAERLGKSINELLSYDHILVMAADQSGKGELELKEAIKPLASQGKTSAPPAKSLQVTTSYYNYVFWKNGGVIGYLHVINGVDYVVTLFSDHTPVNLYYTVIPSN